MMQWNRDKIGWDIENLSKLTDPQSPYIFLVFHLETLFKTLIIQSCVFALRVIDIHIFTFRLFMSPLIIPVCLP